MRFCPNGASITSSKLLRRTGKNLFPKEGQGYDKVPDHTYFASGLSFFASCILRKGWKLEINKIYIFTALPATVIILVHTTKEDGRQCSETSAHKIQTPRNRPKERIQQKNAFPLYIFLQTQSSTVFL